MFENNYTETKIESDFRPRADYWWWYQLQFWSKTGNDQQP